MTPSDVPADTAEGSTPTLRHAPRPGGLEPAADWDTDARNAVEEHVTRYFGPIAWVFHEIVPHLVHLDLLVVQPSDARPFYTLVTSGMSDRPMNVPDHLLEAGCHQLAELMFCLPSDWPMSGEEFRDESAYWPMRLLKVFARLPHEFDTWVGPWHSMPNGDPAQPYAPGLPFVGALLAAPVSVPAEGRTVVTGDGRRIALLAVIPLHQAEMDLKLSPSAHALPEAFDRMEVTEVFDPNRPSSV